MKWLRLCALTALLFSSASVLAQEDPADSRATAFQAVEGAQKESVPGGPLLVSAYAFVLVLLVGYVARLGLMQRKTAAEVERLAQAIEQKRKA
jgi:CcmD family protein